MLHGHIAHSEEGCSQMSQLEQFNLQIKLTSHHGIPGIASKLAFDPTQRLLAIGTLDGKIKLLGNAGIQGLLISESQVRCKFLEFANNLGYLINITADDDIEIWSLETQKLLRTHRWHTNITAFVLIQGTSYMYIGEDSGDINVLQYDKENEKLSQMPYVIPLYATIGGSISGSSLMVIDILPFPDVDHTWVVIAYSNGMIAVWGIFEAQLLRVYSWHDEDNDEKDICCMCWADPSGSVLAVGYTDGDILFWDVDLTINESDRESAVSADPLLKLQISTGPSRSPVLALQWCASIKVGEADVGHAVSGHLFVYGGAEPECLDNIKVYSLASASGELNVTSACHVALPLTGSLDDMILIPRAGGDTSIPSSALLTLTDSGHLHIYDQAIITKCFEENTSFSMEDALAFKPFLSGSSVTAIKLAVLPKEGEITSLLSHFSCVIKRNSPHTLPGGTKWPINGGIINTTLIETAKIHTLLITGHSDGSVNIWDVSLSVVRQLCIYMSQNNRAFETACVSCVEFCSISGVLVMAQKNGVICVYRLSGEASKVHCHYVNDQSAQGQDTLQEAGFQCLAIITIESSDISSLAIASHCLHIGVGYANGVMLWFNLNTGTIVFHGSVFSSEMPVASLLFAESSSSDGHKISDGLLPASTIVTPASSHDNVFPGTVMYAVAMDSSLVGICCKDERPIILWPLHYEPSSSAVNLCYIELPFEEKESSEGEDFVRGCHGSTSVGTSFLILCTKSSVFLFGCSPGNQESLICLHKVNLSPPCYWASAFISHARRAAGIGLLDSMGKLHIRSIPDLDVVQGIPIGRSLTRNPKSDESSILVSGEQGHVALMDADQELFVFSFLTVECDCRNDDIFICLYDKEIASAADAASRAGTYIVKRKGQIPEVIGGMLKDLKGSVMELKEVLTKNLKGVKDLNIGPNRRALSAIFASSPFLERSTSSKPDGMPPTNEPLVVTEDLDIDDIDIEDEDEEPSQETSGSIQKGKDVLDDRINFLGEDLTGPIKRSPEEIKAKYGHRRVGKMSDAASLARDKLLERQEKLQDLGRRTEEMQEGAKNFATMASELAKTMEERKWWQL